MQTHTDRRSPSQVKVGHRGEVEQGKVQVLTRLFHAHWLLETFSKLKANLATAGLSFFIGSVKLDFECIEKPDF